MSLLTHSHVSGPYIFRHVSHAPLYHILAKQNHHRYIRKSTVINLCTYPTWNVGYVYPISWLLYVSNTRSPPLSQSYKFCTQIESYHFPYDPTGWPAWSSTARPGFGRVNPLPANAFSARFPTRLTKTLAPPRRTPRPHLTPPWSSTKTMCSGPEAIPNRTRTRTRTTTNTTRPLLPHLATTTTTTTTTATTTSSTTRRASLTRRPTVSASSPRFPRTKRLRQASETFRTFTTRLPCRLLPLRHPLPPAWFRRFLNRRSTECRCLLQSSTSRRRWTCRSCLRPRGVRTNSTTWTTTMTAWTARCCRRTRLWRELSRRCWPVRCSKAPGGPSKEGISGGFAMQFGAEQVFSTDDYAFPPISLGKWRKFVFFIFYLIFFWAHWQLLCAKCKCLV